jgi:hypothetical protein
MQGGSYGANSRQELLNDIEDASLSLAIELEGQCCRRLRAARTTFAKASKLSPPAPEEFSRE